jgi:ABC-type bacteriocin/lantibiotic exporter with double-glycine peptidase domain
MNPVPNCKQKADHDCGRAAVMSVLMHYGYERSMAKLAADGMPCCETYGTRPEAIEQFFFHRCNVISGTLNIAHLKYFTRYGYPVICAVEDHWVVVDEVSRSKVVYMDPETGKHEQKKIAEFSEWWRDHGRFTTLHRFGIVASMD